MRLSIFEAVLRKYGRQTYLFSPEGEELAEYRAFIQPLRYKNKLYLYGVHTEIGYNSQGHYLYIGPAEHDLQEEGQELRIGQELYRVERAESVYLAGKPLYVWAVVRQKVAVQI